MSVAPPPGHVQPAPQPVPQAKPPSVDLLGDLGGDPFAQPQPQSKDFVFCEFGLFYCILQTANNLPAERFLGLDPPSPPHPSCLDS